MLADEYNKMTAQLTELCSKWREDGIPGVSILAFLLRAAIDTNAHAGVDYDIIQAVLDGAFGRNNMIRPTVQA